jgi:hypothetical protein
MRLNSPPSSQSLRRYWLDLNRISEPRGLEALLDRQSHQERRWNADGHDGESRGRGKMVGVLGLKGTYAST